MPAKKKDKNVEEVIKTEEVFNKNEFLENVKEKGTITLNELVEELSKSGVKDIHFNDVSFNLEKFSIDKISEGFLGENDSLFESETAVEENIELLDVDSKDLSILNCILNGNFEPDDIERLLSVIDITTIKKYVISKINSEKCSLNTLVFLLMDLRSDY